MEAQLVLQSKWKEDAGRYKTELSAAVTRIAALELEHADAVAALEIEITTAKTERDKASVAFNAADAQKSAGDAALAAAHADADALKVKIEGLETRIIALQAAIAEAQTATTAQVALTAEKEAHANDLQSQLDDYGDMAIALQKEVEEIKAAKEQQIGSGKQEVVAIEAALDATAAKLREAETAQEGSKSENEALRQRIVELTVDKESIWQRANTTEKALVKRHKMVWQDDTTVNECRTCKESFSLFRRKHHCRHCGQIHCAECASDYIHLPAHKDKQRVCKGCCATIKGLQEAELDSKSGFVSVFTDGTTIENVNKDKSPVVSPSPPRIQMGEVGGVMTPDHSKSH